MQTSNEIRDSDQHDLQLNQDLYITIAYNWNWCSLQKKNNITMNQNVNKT